MADVFLIGVRGIPNRYGGFERLVEILGPHLATRGHRVTVFCEGNAASGWHADEWHGVRRQFVPVGSKGSRATLQYDWRAFGAVPRGAVALIFGYGTALFQLRLRALGVRHAVNMDGIEWQRQKWSAGARVWLRLNERVASRVSDLLISDHPEIQRYLRSSLGVPSEMIAYGVDPRAALAPLPQHPLVERHVGRAYFLAIARPEPENQLHLLLEAYERSGSLADMLVVGNFQANEYGVNLTQRHSRVVFTGPVYESAVLDALRRHAQLYLHGHSVGGTNPSLIEAMAAGAVVAAHDNVFNRWVLDQGGLFFDGVESLARLMVSPLDHAQRARLTSAALRVCEERYLWAHILAQYEGVVDLLAARN